MRRNASSPANGDGANNLKPSQKCAASETDPAEAKPQNVPSSANSATDGISPVNPNIDRKRKWIMTEKQFPHDNFEHSENRIRPDFHRSPRVIVVDEWRDGQCGFGELNSDGVVEDTTLIGKVLEYAERRLKLDILAGQFEVDRIKYVFVGQRAKGDL
jgi:hypothetical protein